MAMPWGMDCEEYRTFLGESIKQQFPLYKEVANVDMVMWVCVGSGTLFRTLADIFPKAKFYLVFVGADYVVPAEYKDQVIQTFRSKHKYEHKSKVTPPYPSNKW